MDRIVARARSLTGLAVAGLILVALTALTACSPDGAAESGASVDVNATDSADEQQQGPPSAPRGLNTNSDAAAAGYVLYSPLSSGTTYLLDRDAQVVHTWQSDYAPHSLYLLDDGHLLRPGRDPDAQEFKVGGAMGLVQKLTWDGELVWEWKMSDERRILHHDIEPLPNGNFIAIGWEAKTPEEAQAVGRRADLIPEAGLWPDFLIEIEPLPPDDARIVWEWQVWDHLIQNHDPEAANYGDPADHPERIDINAGGPPLEIDAEELERLKALGYVPDDAEEEPPRQRSDFLHINAIDWHPGLDQLLLTVPELGEVWIFERPSSSEEAAGPAGDLLYRWGNPAMYGRGESTEKRLFYPHNGEWIPEGFGRAGNLTIFNNGGERPGGDYSSVEEIAPPLAGDGTYSRPADGAWGPATTVWTYTAAERESFFAAFISGAHRLANGNTFITHGPDGRLFEVTPEGETVWDLGNLFSGNVRQRDGSPPWGGGGDRLRYGVWRAAKLSPQYPGLAGRRLVPLDPQPPMGAEQAPE